MTSNNLIQFLIQFTNTTTTLPTHSHYQLITTHSLVPGLALGKKNFKLKFTQLIKWC